MSAKDIQSRSAAPRPLAPTTTPNQDVQTEAPTSAPIGQPTMRSTA